MKRQSVKYHNSTFLKNWRLLTSKRSGRSISPVLEIKRESSFWQRIRIVYFITKEVFMSFKLKVVALVVLSAFAVGVYAKKCSSGTCKDGSSCKDSSCKDSSCCGKKKGCSKNC